MTKTLNNNYAEEYRENDSREEFQRRTLVRQ